MSLLLKVVGEACTFIRWCWSFARGHMSCQQDQANQGQSTKPIWMGHAVLTGFVLWSCSSGDAQSLLIPRQLELLHKLCIGAACSANKLFTPVLVHKVCNTLVLAGSSVNTVLPTSPLSQGCTATAKTRVLLTTWIGRHGIGKVYIGLPMMGPKVWRLR